MLWAAISALAQPFKEVFESMQQNDRFNNMMNLKDYQAQNPGQSVPYYWLGEVFYEYMLDVDPLLMFDALENNYYEAKLYYGLAKYKLDDKQARQDRDFFGEVKLISDKRKIGMPDILNKIDECSARLETYFGKAKMLHDNYFRFINKYNQCLFKYRDILSKYPNYKDLYLLATPSLINEIQNLELNFDSSLVFFGNYAASSKEFTNFIKVSKYKLLPITTYRLEGLVESDFTTGEVMLWDFGTWTKNFLDLENTDIKQIKNGLPEVMDAFNANMKKLIDNDEYSDDFNRYLVDLKFQNLIGKYDHASLCNELINYEKAKLDFLYQTRSSINNANDSLAFFIINILMFYNDLADAKVKLNEQATALKQSTSFDKIVKYIDFFDKQFRGMDGFVRWCEVEKYRNDEIFNGYLQNLNTFIQRDNHVHDFNDSLLVYNNTKISFGKQYPDSLFAGKDTVYTLSFLPFKNVAYQAGSFVSSNKKIQPYISKISRGGKINWLIKPFEKNKKPILHDETVVNQVSFDSVLYVVSHSVFQENDTANFEQTCIEKIDWNGKVVSKFEFESAMVPVYFWFDEINEQYLFIEQGSDSSQVDSVQNKIVVKLFSKEDSLIWERQFGLNGKFIGVTQTNSNFLITCNYSAFDYDNEHLQTFNNQKGILNLYLTRSGDVNHLYTYQMDKGITLENSFKLSDNTINLFGTSDISDTGSPYFYLLMSNAGEPQFCNLKDLKSERIGF